MSPFLLPMFGFMLVTFLLGFALAWLIWKFGHGQMQDIETVNTEIDFWRSNLEQCRFERDNEQKALAAIREEKSLLKRRVASLEDRLQQAQAKP